MLVYSRPNKFGTKLHQDDQDKRSIFTKQTYLHFSKDNFTTTEAILRITLSYLPSPLWRVYNPCWEGLRGLTTPTIQRKLLVPKKNAKFAKRLQVLYDRFLVSANLGSCYWILSKILTKKHVIALLINKCSYDRKLLLG